MQDNQNVLHKDKKVKIGDKLADSESDITILDYNSKRDEYLCDIFSRSGKLIGPQRPVNGVLVRQIFMKTD